MQANATTLAIAFVMIVSLLAPNDSRAASAADRAIAQAQHKIRRNPNNAQAYYELGDGLIQKARESGDMSQIDLAEKALRKSLAINPQQSGVLRHLAHVLSSRHDFAGAAAEAQRAIAQDGKDADAYAVLGDAFLDMGKYAEAEEAYKSMIGLKESLSSYSRLSGLKSLKGDSAGAMADLRKAIQLGVEQNQPAESIAWAEWQLGMEHFALGRLKEAESSIRAALERQPNYHRGVAGLAQVRAAQGNYKEAIALYQKTLNAIPNPEYAAALGDIYKKLGHHSEAKKQYDLVEYIGRLNSFNQALYNRELAYFYCDHDQQLPYALQLARNELTVRQDIYAYDVLAWCLHKNGRNEEAKTAIDQALKLGTRDAKLFYHAGMIHHALKDANKARQWLQMALQTNPQFHVLHADTARAMISDTSAIRRLVHGPLANAQ